MRRVCAVHPPSRMADSFRLRRTRYSFANIERGMMNGSYNSYVRTNWMPERNWMLYCRCCGAWLSWMAHTFLVCLHQFSSFPVGKYWIEPLELLRSSNNYFSWVFVFDNGKFMISYIQCKKLYWIHIGMPRNESISNCRQATKIQWNKIIKGHQVNGPQFAMWNVFSSYRIHSPFICFRFTKFYFHPTKAHNILINMPSD